MCNNDSRPFCKTCVEFLLHGSTQLGMDICRLPDPWAPLPQNARACSEYKTWLDVTHPIKFIDCDGVSKPQSPATVNPNDLIWETDGRIGCNYSKDAIWHYGLPNYIQLEQCWYLEGTFNTHQDQFAAPTPDHYPWWCDKDQCWYWRVDHIIKYTFDNHEWKIGDSRFYTFEKQPSYESRYWIVWEPAMPPWHPFKKRDRLWMDTLGFIWEAPNNTAEPVYDSHHTEWLWMDTK